VGLFGRLRKSSPAVPIELLPEALRDADECHRTGLDAGRCTRGRGSAQLFTVAGPAHRQQALQAVVAGRGGPAAVTGMNLPAALRRDPTNPHDSSAIRVLVDGVHIGFVPAREAPRVQPLLQECERRGLVMVGSVRLTGDAERGWGAGLQVRPNLDGWESPAGKKPPVKKAPARVAPPTVLLVGSDLEDVVQTLRRLVGQDSVRTKQHAGLVVKTVRELLPPLQGHAEALEVLDEQRGVAFGDDVLDVEDTLEDLRDAEDADEREDAHVSLQAELEDVLARLTA
jgi:hypothetical protein